MPTYEYECSNGHQFEVVQRITEDPLERCQLCRAKVRRLISPAAFILKGSGWYADGYGSGSGNGAKRSEAKSSTDSAPGAGSESSSDSSSTTSNSSSKPSSSGTSSGKT